MTPDLQQILESKRVFRRALAARDISEKLAMLDELRARTLTLRSAREALHPTATVQEEPAPYRTAPRDP